MFPTFEGLRELQTKFKPFGGFVKNRVLIVLLVCACLVAGAPLWGQNSAAQHGIRGYLDPLTGAFHSLPQPEADVEPAALTTFAGKFVFKFTITVNATIASAAKIACAASIGTDDNLTGGNPNFISEEAVAPAVRSGSTATCTVNIPYSWALATGATDTISVGYNIIAPVEVAAVTGQLPSRASSASLPTIKVPASGTTTTETITATF
jgi:hypothetical protein